MKPSKSTPFRSHASITAAFSVALFTHFAAPSALAATSTWTGISGNWSDTTTPGGVWTAGTPADGAGFTANFTGVDIAAAQTITLDSARTIGNITFTDATTSSHGLTISGANILTLDVTSGAPLMNITNQSLTISSEIQGTEGLTKSGAGDLVLGGTNSSFSGPVSINAGVLTLNNNTSALGTTSGIKMANGTDLRLNGVAAGTLNYNYPISVTSGTATIKSFQGISETFNLGGAISGLGGVTFANESSGSSVVLNFVPQQPNTYVGNTTITAAVGTGVVVKLGVANALPTTTTLTINQGSGANGSGRTSALDLAGFNQTIAGLVSTNIFQFENAIVRNSAAGAATLTINNNSGSPRTFTGKIQQTGTLNLVKTGANTQILAANNSYTGTTTVNAGALTLDFTQFGSSSTNTPANYINAASPLELGGGTFTVKGRANGSAVASAAWTGGGTTKPDITFATLPAGIVVGQAITGTGIGPSATYIVGIDTTAKKVSLNALISGAGSATSGTLSAAATTVTTSQTFANTTVNSGASKLTIDANSGDGTKLALNAITRNIAGTVNFTQPSGTISATNGFTTSTANTAGTILGGWATVGGAGWATNDGTNVVALGSYTLTSVAGTSAAAYAGADIEVDNSAGLLDGVVTPNSIRFNAAAANIVTLAAGNNTITSGGILVTSTVGANASRINSGTLRGASGSDLVVNQYNTLGSLTIASVIDDNTTATALTKSGAGTLVLTGTNTYTGNTYLNEGSLIVSAANNLGASSSNLVFNGGTLHISGTTLTNLSSLGRTVSVTPGKTVGLTIGDPANSFTVDQVLNQTTGGFTKAGTGTVILDQANSYTGPTTISGGTLTLSGSGTMGSGANLTLSGGQLDLNSTSATVGAVSITAAYASGDTILNGSLTGTSYAASNTTGNPIISANLLANGAAGFTKTGAGTTTLSGTNTYTGTTAAGGGVLKIASASALGGGNLTLGGGGVLGLTANFSRAEGTGAGQFQWTGSGGFAAYGADRTVTTGTLSWGSTSLTGNTIVLGAADADATVIWTSNISLAGGSRTIQANDGSAPIDAIMSGQILSSAGNLAKTGTGTLALKTTSLYTGTTTVSAGTLMLGDGTGNTGNLSTTSSIAVSTGATLAVNRTGAVTQATDLNGKIISGAGSFLQAGSGTTTLSLVNTYTGATTVSAGTLTLGATGSITTSSSVSIGAAGTLDTSAQASYAIPAAQPVAFGIDPAGAGSIGKIVAANLDITNAVVTLSPAATLDDPVYVPATYSGTLTGAAFAAPLPTVPSGYTLNYAYEGNKIALVQSGGDVTPPTLTSIVDDKSGGPVTEGTLVTYTVTFNEDMDDATVTAAAFDNDGTAAVTIVSVTETTPTSGVFTVLATPTTAGSLKLRIPSGAVVKDVAGNDLVVPVSDDTTITVQTQYQAWAGGALFDADANGDGVKNGLAWILGASGPGVSALDKLPAVSTSGGNMVLTFKRIQASINANTALTIEVGTTLASWPTAYTVGTDTAGSSAGVTVAQNTPGAGTDTVTLTVTLSPDAKKFARLKAVEIP